MSVRAGLRVVLPREEPQRPLSRRLLTPSAVTESRDVGRCGPIGPPALGLGKDAAGAGEGTPHDPVPDGRLLVPAWPSASEESAPKVDDFLNLRSDDQVEPLDD